MLYSIVGLSAEPGEKVLTQASLLFSQTEWTHWLHELWGEVPPDSGQGGSQRSFWQDHPTKARPSTGRGLCLEALG